MQKPVIFVKKILKIKMKKTKNIIKIDIIFIILVRIGMLHIANKLYLSKEFTLIFNNSSNYDYHFIVKELAEECKGQFTCLGNNYEKHMFSAQVDKEVTRIDKNRKEIKKPCLS